MRRKERLMRNEETLLALLKRAQVGRLATINRKGFPVIKPVNFVYDGGKIFFHSATKGEKVADIRRGSPICFEVDEPIAYVTARGPACKASYYYRSIIIKGRATFVKGTKPKQQILEKLMEKYQPQGGYDPPSEEVVKRTAVIEIAIDEMTGKESLG